VLKPRKLIDPSQGWFWTKEWQTMESEADKQIELNEISEKFDSPEDAIQSIGTHDILKRHVNKGTP